MVKIIMGLKGSGKTKRLVDLVRETVAEDNGDVVVIENNKNLTYDIPYQARLIDTNECGIKSYDLFKGFILGLHSGNYDITHFYVDNFLKIVKDNSLEGLEEFLVWLEEFSNKESIEFIMSISADPEAASEKIKSYII